MHIQITQFPVGGSKTLEVIAEADTPQTDLTTVTSINVTLSAVERARNRLRLAFTRAPEILGITARVSHELPERLTDGYYVVAVQVNSNKADNNSFVAPRQEVSNQAFLVVNGALADQKRVSAATIELERARFAYLNAAIRTKSSSETQSGHFSVDFFCIGSLIHGRQDLEGYMITPLNRAFNYAHMLDPINAFEQQTAHVTVQFSEKIQEQYARDSPLFVVAFKDVIATGYEDAENHCWELVDNINTILTLEKGYRPKVFATISRMHGTSGIRQVIYHEGYSGNLVPGFVPTETADKIDFELPMLIAKPRIKLLYQSYAEALSEKTLDFAYFKFWTLLELIADTRIHDICDIKYSNGDVVVGRDGKPVTTKYAAGKVYQLLSRANLTQSRHGAEGVTYVFENHVPCTAKTGEKLYSLWDITCGLYEIRNATAHEGKFDAARARLGNPRERIAAELYELPHGVLWHHVKWVVLYVIGNEMRDAAAPL